ncbi:uncharacterized protein LOC144153890 [Haemaphysalis longicornis]
MDYGLSLDDMYVSPATMAKYMDSYSFPGPVDYVSAATASPDGGMLDFYPTFTSGSAFDNYAFSPTIKLDELEPMEPAPKHSGRHKNKALHLRGNGANFAEGTREDRAKIGGKGGRRPEAGRNSEEPQSFEEETQAGRRKRPHGNSGSYFRGVPDRDDDSSEEDESEPLRDDDGSSPSSTTSLSDRDEIAYSRGNSRRPFVRVKNSGALTSEEASSEEARRGVALRGQGIRPSDDGANRDQTTNEMFETGQQRNIVRFQNTNGGPPLFTAETPGRGNGDADRTSPAGRFPNGNGGPPLFLAETPGSRNGDAGRASPDGRFPNDNGRPRLFLAETPGSRNGDAGRASPGTGVRVPTGGDNDGVRDVRYSYSGNGIDANDGRTPSGAALRDAFTPTSSTTESPEDNRVLQPSGGDTSSGRASKPRRRPLPAYTPDSTEYDPDQEEDRGGSSRDREQTTTSGYSLTLEPTSSEEERRREESSDSPEDKMHALMRPTQTAARPRRPAQQRPAEQRPVDPRPPVTSLFNGGSGAARSVSATSGQQNVNMNRNRARGGYGTPAPVSPPPLPPASSFVLLGRDPTPSLDQKAAATATAGAEPRTAAATGGAGNGGRPRTLFHQQGFQGPYSYRFGFDTADPYNPQTRYEEKDASGHVRGSYSFLDPKGRLQVVRYEADPKGGFRVKGSFGQYPNDKKP